MHVTRIYPDRYLPLRTAVRRGDLSPIYQRKFVLHIAETPISPSEGFGYAPSFIILPDVIVTSPSNP